MRHPYLVATRFALLEHARNRFALGLLLVFVPLWFAVIGLMVPGDPVAFKLMSTGALVQVDGHRLTLITAGFNALTLIVGFMLFATTRRNARFDRRLVLAGYARPVLLLAKLTALLAVAALVALYAAVVLVFYWPSRTLPFVWLGYFGDALIYGALGVLLGALVTSELAGFFVLIMVSLMDTFLQAPVANPLANKPFLIAFPTYGPMQVAISGAFTRTLPVAAVLLALAWCAGFAALGLGIFWWRTRPRATRTAPLEHPATALASLEPPPAR